MAAAFPDHESLSIVSAPEQQELDSEIEHIMRTKATEMDDVNDFIKKNQLSIERSKESLKKLDDTMQSLISTASSRAADLERRARELAGVKKALEEVTMEDISREEEELKSLLTSGFSILTLTTEIGNECGNTTSGDASAQENTDSSQINGSHDTNISNGHKCSPDTNDIQQHSNNVPGHDSKMIISEDGDVVSQIQELRETLNLKLVTANQDMIIVEFNNISSSPESYRFTFMLDQNDVYNYLDCVPEVEDIKPMIEALNIHRNVSRFLTNLRKEFTDLSKENGSPV